MPNIEINLVDLAVYLEDRGGDPHDGLTEWGVARGLDPAHIEYVWEQFGADEGQNFIGLCHDVSSITLDLHSKSQDSKNQWMIPESYADQDPNRQYAKFLVSRPDSIVCKQIYTTDGELLIPAPYGISPKKVIQHGWHFMFGVESTMPAICGEIESRKQMNGNQFLELVESAACSDSVQGIGIREICFFLDRIAKMPVGKLGGVRHRDVSGVSNTRTELAISKFFARRREG